jgi:hypothetical protein
MPFATLGSYSIQRRHPLSVAGNVRAGIDAPLPCDACLQRLDPSAENLVHPALPASAPGPVGFDDLRVQPERERLLGWRLLRPALATATLHRRFIDGFGQYVLRRLRPRELLV